MELFQAGHEIKYFRLRRVATGVIFLGRLDNDVDDVGETAAATAAFFHSVIDLRRHDKLPTVFIEKVGDNLPDFLVGYIIAAADKHVFIPNMTLTIVFSAKEDGGCQEKIRAPLHRTLCRNDKPVHVVRDYAVLPG
ncbi:hypothetical protein GGE66_004940 [Rhizobium leguminosarum]|uniref:Uncharacterized protein n=1 Tax=Rhizobium leguminosarum TaxID=384 RepID=A0A7W9ZW57_RHILE|nr:hypothetical protein [Rhizobium leguminosarum]